MSRETGRQAAAFYEQAQNKWGGDIASAVSLRAQSFHPYAHFVRSARKIEGLLRRSEAIPGFVGARDENSRITTVTYNVPQSRNYPAYSVIARASYNGREPGFATVKYPTGLNGIDAQWMYDGHDIGPDSGTQVKEGDLHNVELQAIGRLFVVRWAIEELEEALGPFLPTIDQ